MATDLEDYSLARVIKGIYDSEYKTIAVDTDGNIVGVFKGDYAGTLTTLAVDSHGRIQAVLTDPEDVFGNPAYMGAAELAARLGSIKSYERRGTVLWMDDFEAPTLGWSGTSNDVDGSVKLNVTHHRSRSQSVKMDPGNEVDKYAVLETLLPVRNTGILGYEIAWCGGTLEKTIDFRFHNLDATNSHKAEIRFDVVNDKLQYLNSGGTYTDITATANLSTLVRCWHIIKLVVDFDNDEYKRVYVDHNEYSLADIGFGTAEDANGPYVFVGVKVTSANVLAQDVYVDNFILTENEP